MKKSVIAMLLIMAIASVAIILYLNKKRAPTPTRPHVIVGDNPATWSPTRPRVIVGDNPATWSPTRPRVIVGDNPATWSPTLM